MADEGGNTHRVYLTNPGDISGGGGGGGGAITGPLGSRVSAQAVSVVVASDQAAVPVSATALPLPTGAAAETTQGFVRTAVEALAALISGGSLKSVLTAGAAVIGHVILDASSAVIGHVIVDTSGLPTGAATAAKQPALGTAGSASADVTTVQGVASMKELLVQVIAGTAVMGHVILDAGTAAIGKLAANTAATYIGDVVLQASTAAIGKLAANAGVVIGAVELQTSTATPANVASSATNVTLLAGNANRKGATIVNDSTSALYVKLSTAGSAASATSYSYYLPGITASGVPSTMEVPYRCVDPITGIWVSANGNARVTEYV